MSKAPGNSLMIAGSIVRLAYALPLLLAPEAMSARRFAPDVRGDSYGRMLIRAFGGVHTHVALLTLRAAVLNRDTRLAVGLNLGCDGADMAATLLEWRRVGRPEFHVVGSIAVQSAGLAAGTYILRNL